MTFDLISDGEVINTTEAPTLLEAIEAFFGHDHVITAVSADEATVISEEKAFIVRRRY